MENFAKNMDKQIKEEKQIEDVQAHWLIKGTEIKTIFLLADERRLFKLIIARLEEKELPHSADERVTEEKIGNTSPNLKSAYS